MLAAGAVAKPHFRSGRPQQWHRFRARTKRPRLDDRACNIATV